MDKITKSVTFWTILCDFVEKIAFKRLVVIFSISGFSPE